MEDRPVADSRHVRGAGATLQVTWNDETGEPANASGAVTVEVQNGDGTDLLSAGSSTTTGDDTGVYQRVLTPAQTADLQLYTAIWTDAGTGATRQTIHEICGRMFFTIEDARNFDTTLANADNYSDTTIQAFRAIVEDECELITATAWVPRYRRQLLDGTDDIQVILDRYYPRVIRSCQVITAPAGDTVFSDSDLAALALYEDGTIMRPQGDTFQASDTPRNVIVEYEYGFDRPPADLVDAILLRLRHRLNRTKSGIPDKASQLQVTDVGTVQLANTGPALYRTGIPDVDAVYRRYSFRENRVVDRSFDFDPQRMSLFHGGRR